MQHADGFEAGFKERQAYTNGACLGYAGLKGLPYLGGAHRVGRAFLFCCFPGSTILSENIKNLAYARLHANV